MRLRALDVVMLVAVLGFAGVGCGRSTDRQEQATVAIGSEFSLAIGHSVLVAGREVTVTFDSVTEDSRCPPDKVCVWEGDATVRVSVGARGDPTPIMLHTSPRFTTAAEAAGLRVRLIALNTPADLLTLRVDAR